MPQTFPALLSLLLLTGCMSLRTPDDAVRSSVVSGRAFKQHLGNLASGSADVAMVGSYVAYLGSDSSFHHFRQREAGGVREIWVPRADLVIRQEFPYDAANPRAFEMNYANFAHDNPYEIRGLGQTGAAYPQPFNAPKRVNEYGQPKPWPAFGIDGGEPMPGPLNGNGR